MIDIKEKTGYSYIPIIAGPTASGKSAIALRLCEETGGELVSCDSMQIYKGLNIGTAKDSQEECAAVPHHLYDILEPGQNFSVNQFTVYAGNATDDILSRNKLPVYCGGTGQYISAMYFGLKYGDFEIPETVTACLNHVFETEGIEPLYKRLEQVDPEAASKIHPNNTRRVIRALAVYEATGVTFTEKNEESQKDGPAYPFKLFVLNPDREELYDRINKRVDLMIESGLVDEARKLYDMDIPEGSTCLQAIGYKEFKDYFDGKITLDEAAENIKLNTRHYAKRQITWFKSIEGRIMIEPKQNFELILECIR